MTDELLRAARPVRESTPEQDAAFERKLDALLPNVAAKSNVLAFEPKPSVSKRRRWQLPVYAALAASFAFIMVRIVPAPDPGYRGGGTVHAMATVADPESAVSKMMLELRRLGLDPASTERNGVWKLTVQVPEQSAGAVAEVFAPFNLEHADGPLRGDVEITVLETLRE